ncbi:diacylglycerol/lipid kinase family protein [Pseudonocardia nigra]|uniref:diacylglycerol/lipid kinase family protein n=1 Tax=Pseudonocardia nigra TaxID=1921578 RepID=UPI001C5E0F89|nr:diacylglycerol kinase family protein [Pseudonocardia nigra]
MARFTAVVNPAAGRGTGAAIAARVAAAMPAGAVEVVHSIDHGHAHELAAQACAQGRTVLAVGGDGHAGCVAGAVIAGGGVLGLVPAGRGNDFARQLGLPVDPEALAAVFQAGRTRTVDVLTCDGRVVLGSVYAGVDSVASAIVNARPRVPGPLVYPYAAVRVLLTFRPAAYRLAVDGEVWAERGYTVVIANSGYYGGGMHIVPTAAVDDGMLDVLLIRDSSRWNLIASIREVYAGTHLRRTDIEVRRARVVELAADRPVPVHADGAPVGDGPVRVAVRPAALTLLSP